MGCRQSQRYVTFEVIQLITEVYSMTIKDTLLQRFGPLMSLAQLAALLDRSPDGLRISLRSTSNEWAKRVNETRLKIGVRIYFRTSQIAEVLSDDTLYHTGN